MKFIRSSLALIALIAATVRLFAAVETGQAAPDFSLTDIDGQKHALSEYRGKTVVLVGHEPLLSQTALELAGLRGTAELKKGGCYVFRLREASFELENMLTPRVLRHIST